jgi:psiF repeat
VRFATVAAAVCLSLLAVAGGLAAGPPARSTDVPATAAPGTAGPAAAPGIVAPAAASASNDAAAKHAKRTACLKSAKTKKLVGADKTAFLKSCIAAP